MTEPACPICSRPATAAYRPFCSKRCADVDLQRWFSGAYAVPAEEEPDASAETPGGAAGRPPDDPL